MKWLDELFGINTAAQKDINELLRQVDDLFDAQGGKLLNAAGLKLLKAQLWEKYGVKLRLIEKEVGSSEMRKLLKDWDKRGVVGRFREGPPPEMILRAENASELTVFHEMTHLEITVPPHVLK